MTVTSEAVRLFDEVAEVYDRVRPGYPDALVRDVMEFGGLRAGMTVLEVGAGTGLATLAFARCGLRVHCVEPSRSMASILAARTADLPDVTIDVADFGELQVERGGYDAVIAGQCWQYLDPADRLDRSAYALGDSGILAVFWNSRPRPAGTLAAEVDRAHRTHAPELRSQGRPQAGGGGRRFAAHSEVFRDIELRHYRGTRRYDAEEFVSLLGTYAEYRALPAERRSALYSALRERVSRRGSGVEMIYDTVLHLARVGGR
jgi:SAM-dependent methyltransferase